MGIGNTDDQNQPQRCIFQDDEKQPLGTPITITAGGNHTLVLFDSGRLFSAGFDSSLAGSKSSPANFNTFFTELVVPSRSRKIKLCSATWEASIIVTREDEVYAIGSGPQGELGIDTDYVHTLQKLPNFPPSSASIVDISSGIRHTVVVLSNGEVYGWGNARKGKLGYANDGIIRTPQKMSGLAFGVSKATCGREFTYIVGDPSKTEHQVVGSDQWNVKSSAPSAPWPRSTGLKGLGSSWCGIYTLDSSGKISSWGRNDRGQLAPQDLPEIKQIAVGSEHTLALTENGEVLAWGWGEHGNCGPKTDQHGNVRDRWQQILPKSPFSENKVLTIGAGCATSYIWTSSNQFITSGQGRQEHQD